MRQDMYAYDDDMARGAIVDDSRATFIRKTYLHLAGAIAVFAMIETALFASGMAESIIGTLFVGSNVGMLFLLAAFIGAGWLAQYWARADQPLPMQYFGLGLYILVEVLIFLPLLYIAVNFSSPDVLPTAGLLTLFLSGGLTMAVFVSGKDFSFLRPIITIGSFVALGTVFCAILFGFSLGLFFSVAMVGLASISIVYSTSNVLHHYGPSQYVAAALDLFASVALLFYYVLRILISLDRR